MTYSEALQILQNTSPLRITVSGDIGSGKSTFAKRLAQELNIPRVYAGGLFREKAQELGITLDELNARLEKDDTLDREIDEKQRTKAREHDRIISEGRTAWYFVENPDVKVFLAVNPQTAAQRIWDDTSDNRDRYGSIEELAQANIDRKASEEKRYQRYYGISAYDRSNFDVVIDTTNLSIQEVFETTLVAIAQHARSQNT